MNSIFKEFYVPSSNSIRSNENSLLVGSGRQQIQTLAVAIEIFNIKIKKL